MLALLLCYSLDVDDVVCVIECVINCVLEEGICIGDLVCGVVVVSIDEMGDIIVCYVVEGV